MCVPYNVITTLHEAKSPIYKPQILNSSQTHRHVRMEVVNTPHSQFLMRELTYLVD